MSEASVYVVEDEAAIAMELCDRLRSLGYQVLGRAAHGERALADIEQSPPDLVLMDIGLAGPMTGVDVAERLRERGHDTAIVFLTAYSDAELLQRAGGVEPAGYLVKPFDERELHATLQMAYFKRLAERERRLRLEERHALQARLAQAQKDESLTRMAGAVAHSVNNTLGGLLGLVALARDSVGQPSECEATLDEVTAEIERAAELGRTLRQYAGGAVAQPEVIELGQLCRDASRPLEALLPRGVRLTTTICSAPVFVRADAVALRDAVVQLVTNAGEAMAGGQGDVAIAVSVVTAGEIPANRAWPAEWSPAGRSWACLAVRDDDGGIASADLERIFDPFFSTKLLGRGLGLPLLLATVRSFDGAVSVETGAGGSTFRLLLPLAENVLEWGGEP